MARSTERKRTSRVVIAVVVALIALPLVAVIGTVIAAILLGTVAGAGAYVAIQENVGHTRRDTLPEQIARLQRGAADLKGLGKLAPCASEAEATDALVKAPMEAAAPGEGDWDGCLIRLGASRDAVYGRYWLEVDPDGRFTVHGIVDADGDGKIAHVTAAESGPVIWITPDDVY